MRTVILTLLLVALSGRPGVANLGCFQEQMRRLERGEYADQIDENIENRIETQLRDGDPHWSVTILKHSSQGGQRLLELRHGTLRVTTSIVYMKSSNDAAKHLQYGLQVIQIPVFKKLAGLGDEGYTMTETGPLEFRIQTIVVQISSSDQSVVTETAVAHRVISAVHKG